jgi:8-oxo-dGTP pyrophosphatase MutT (NUDIX family)
VWRASKHWLATTVAPPLIDDNFPLGPPDTLKDHVDPPGDSSGEQPHNRGRVSRKLNPRESGFMEWRVVSERPLYTDDWLKIRIADVDLPDGTRLEHRLIRTHPGAGTVAIDPHQRVLLLWRHRFITKTWGWEIPIGRIEAGESPADAAKREFQEETGYRPGSLRPMLQVQPTPGLTTSVHHIFRADEATEIGPADRNESDRVAWIALADLRSLIDKGEITSGTTLAALLYLLCEHG